ncbi:MAG: hypothetical protein O6943_03580 [Bacteroidetes bacterium]|nr:hypothetical protein [Bacteroidota bacterium]
MKGVLFVILSIFFGIQSAFAQIETNTNTVQFETKDANTKDPTGIELPLRDRPGLTLPKDERDPMTNMSLSKDEPEQFDMMKGDGLLLNDKGNTPKAFVRDKEPLPEYGRDQYLGDVTTGSKFVSIKYRDHEFVDGDLIRIYVNKDIVQSSVYLGSRFSGFTLTLVEGVNEIVFEALNQGTSGPNTAELHVYDDNGTIISAKQWNLLTGNRATIKVIKE